MALAVLLLDEDSFSLFELLIMTFSVSGNYWQLDKWPGLWSVNTLERHNQIDFNCQECTLSVEARHNVMHQKFQKVKLGKLS